MKTLSLACAQLVSGGSQTTDSSFTATLPFTALPAWVAGVNSYSDFDFVAFSNAFNDTGIDPTTVSFTMTVDNNVYESVVL
jgi:hypothetical protein